MKRRRVVGEREREKAGEREEGFCDCRNQTVYIAELKYSIGGEEKDGVVVPEKSEI